MNRMQTNVVDMGSTVSVYMDKNKTIWGDVKAIADAVNDVNTTLAGIADADKKKQSATKGAGQDKSTARHDLEDQILVIADQLVAYGEATQNPKLVAQAETTLPTLDKLSAQDLVTAGKTYSDLATANLAALADYGVEQDDVTELDDLTKAFSKVKTEPRDAVVEQSKQTGTVQGLTATLRTILRRRLDKLMTQFKRSDPEFYAGYLAARVIVDRGGGGGKKQPPTPPVTPPAAPQK